MAGLLVPLLALLGVSILGVVAAPIASAVTPGLGPVDPTTHFPTYYADANGLGLQMCLDGPPNCLTSGADLTAPAGEGFYFSASSDLGPLTVANTLEGAYFAAGTGQEITFMRSQVSANKGGLTPNGNYTVTDPYGTLTCTADGSGTIKNHVCRTETPSFPQNFTAAQQGRIGPFLTWDTFGQPVGAPPTGYIGDSVTPHKVTGSPTGYNKVRVQGPGLTGTCTNADGTTVTGCQETDLFTVQGKVAAGASATTSPNALDFGNTATPVTQTVTYTSTGTAPVTVTGITPTGGDATDFSIPSETCTGAPIAPGTNCTIDVTYTPRPGTTSTSGLAITDSTGTTRPSIPLTGSSTGTLTLDQSAMSYGNQKAGTSSVPQVVTVSNTGVASSAISGATLGGTGASQFAISSNGCTTVAPGASCGIGVTFKPTTGGAKTATLTITDSGGKTYPVTLSGTATAPVVSPSTTSMSFADTLVGQTSTPQSVVLTNSGTAPVTIGGNDLLGQDASQFTRPTNTCAVGATVAPGATCVTQVAFAPASGGPKSGMLTITADGTPYSVSLAGNATVPTDTTAPTAPSTVTAKHAAGAAGVSTIVVGWSPATDNVAVTGYQVVRDGTLVGTTAGDVRKFNDTGLAAGTTHSYVVKALDAAGNVSAPTSPAASASTTATDTTPPALATQTPAKNATAVAPAATVTAGFSEAVVGVTPATFTLKNPAGTAVAATVAKGTAVNTWVLTPSAALAQDTKYTVGLATTIHDAAGNAFAGATWTFTTGPAPTITVKSPAASTSGVARTGNVTATFSEQVVGVAASFTLHAAVSNQVVTATVTKNPAGTVWTLNPGATLAANTRYTATITGGTTGARDAAGNPLANTVNWSFITGAT